MRTFIALELPTAFADDVAGLARQMAAVVDGRFMARESYHLTLAFLGELDEAGSREAIAALDATAAVTAPVELRAEGLGTFGRPHDATLWLGISASEELAGLARHIRAGLAERWVSYDDKPFRPHVTLARRARLPRGAMPRLAFPLPDVARYVTLYKSTLSSEGASYKPLYTVELSARP